MQVMTNTIRPDEYMAMRKAVGWHEFPLEQAAEGLKNCYIWCIREDDRPIALGRIIWDHGYVMMYPPFFPRHWRNVLSLL